MWRLERRDGPPRWGYWAAPLLALVAALGIAAGVFAALGVPPGEALYLFTLAPLGDLHALAELGLKATPLVLCAVGLALCLRAGIWNIGAEGQLIAGAIAASGVALMAPPGTGDGYVSVVALAGAAGGMAWAGIVAWLRDRWGASELLCSLMLVYVAQLLLGYLVFGPWRDPMGFNFPQSRLFDEGALLPNLVPGTRLHAGVLLAGIAVVASAVFLGRTQPGFQLQVAGLAPAAARYAGYGSRQTLWVAMLGCGALAGLAGMVEVSGPIQRLTASVSPGYGFTAIIVAFLGRLHPLGIVVASLVLSVLYLGGELAQSRLGLPASTVGVFQGALLACLLAIDALLAFRLRAVPKESA